MKLIIAGSREIAGKQVNFTIAEIERWLRFFNLEPTEIVCGKARGTDTSGENWAKHKGIHVEPFPANWKKYGLGAGAIRNGEMAKYADILLLIWDGNSRGSYNMKKQMKEQNKPIYEIILNEYYNVIGSKTPFGENK